MDKYDPGFAPDLLWAARPRKPRSQGEGEEWAGKWLDFFEAVAEVMNRYDFQATAFAHPTDSALFVEADGCPRLRIAPRWGELSLYVHENREAIGKPFIGPDRLRFDPHLGCVVARPVLMSDGRIVRPSPVEVLVKAILKHWRLDYGAWSEPGV